MNILDENMPNTQRHILRNWRIRARQIGHEVGRKGMEDEEIIPLLHRLGPATFFTRDLDFYDRHLCHSRYCLVCLSVGKYDMASFIRRFLRHPMFNTSAKRMGKVIQVSHTGMRAWQPYTEKEEKLVWLN